jgi:hypothetical protein
MKNTTQNIGKILLVFFISNLVVTAYFFYVYNPLVESADLKLIVKIIKQYGLIISIPTSILFVLIDIILIKMIKKNWILYVSRIIIFFGLLYLMWLFFSIYLIASALIDNPLMDN